MIAPVDRQARRSVLAAFAIQGLTFASLLTRLPVIKDRFDLSDLDILGLVTAVAVLSAVGSVVAGQVAARWGSARTLRACLAAASVCAVLPGLAGSFVTLILGTAAYGFFVGGVDASGNMQGVAVQDRYGRSIMTGFHAMWSLAAACGAAYAALTAGLGWSLATSLTVVAMVGLGLNAWLCRDLLAADLDPLETSAASAAASRPWWPVLLIAVPTFVMWLGDGATSTWSGIYLQDGLHASAGLAPAAYGAYELLLFALRVVGDRLVQRYGAARVIRTGGWVATGGLVLIVAAPALWLVIAGFALLGAGLSLVPPLSMVAAAHVAPGAGDQAVARVNVANYAGFIAAAVGIALLSESTSARTMFLVPLALAPALPLMARQFTPRRIPVSDAA